MDASDHRFLGGFTPAARERLTACMLHENHPDGAYLFHEGDVADGVYLLLEGEVEIFRPAGSHEKVLDLKCPGDYFGEVAVLDGLGRSTAARARGAITIARIPGEVLLEVLSHEPGTVTLGLLRQVLAHLRKTTDLVIREIVHKEKLSLVGEMASSLMHDLRTPVTSIRLRGDLIKTTSHDGKVLHWCDGIRLQCDRLGGMASELMEFSKGESKLTLSRTTTTEFLEQFKSLNEGFLTPPRVETHFEAVPAEIEIDSMRLQRVLQNLMNNAIEALRNTPKPCLRVRAWVENSTFYLAVKDNGPGISLAIQNHLFEPFVTHGKKEGIGLGMAIVRNIVTAHGGAVTFETSPEHGTSFLISLPQTAVMAENPLPVMPR